MIRISFNPSTFTHAAIWWRINGNPAIGNNGFGTSNERGRNRVPKINNEGAYTCRISNDGVWHAC